MRTAATTLVTLGLAAVLVLGVPHRGHAWTFQYDDDEHDRDLVSRLHVGPGGELYAAAVLEQYEGALFRLDPATGATIWKYDLEAPPALLYDAMADVTTDAAGNVFAAGSLNFHFDAARVDAATGQEVWHTSLAGGVGTNYNFARSIAIDGFGGVVVSGGIQEHSTPFGPDFAVVRFDTATGAVLWKSVVDGGASDGNQLFLGESAEDVAIAPNGDVIAVGYLTVIFPGEPGEARLIAAMRFARDDGHEIWRWTYRASVGSLGENFGDHVALDAAGNVIVSGRHGFLGGNGGTAAVFKLDGATGTELWRYISTDDSSDGIAVNDADDVVVAARTRDEGFAGTSHTHFTVLKLSGSTGVEIWRTEIGDGRRSEAHDVLVDAAQDVIAVGSRRGTVAAMKLAGSDGHVLWTRASNPLPAVYSFWGFAALDGSGHVFAGGTTSGPPQYAPEDLYVSGLDAATGAGVGCGNGVLDAGETCDDGNAADFDGCSGICTVEHCSDGVVDPDEQCDDGGHVGGDGCDAQCNFEGCGDGEVGPGEECDDGNRTSDDLCSATCRIEICEAPNVPLESRIRINKLGGVAGDERMSLRMKVTSPIGTSNRMQLIVEDVGAGGSPLLDLSYRTNPLGGVIDFPRCDALVDVWRQGSGGFSYRNRTNTLPPDCAPGSARGLRKMSMKAVRSIPNGYVIKATFQNSSLPAPVGPLRVTIVGDENVDTLFPGTCWQSPFTTSQCVASSSAISCR